MKRSSIAIAALMIVTLAPPVAAQIAPPSELCAVAAFPNACRACVRAAQRLGQSGFLCVGVTAFDAQATLSADGRAVLARGDVRPCLSNEDSVKISVAVIQDSVETAAQGDTLVACEPAGERPRFIVSATVPAGKPGTFLVEEAARACAVASTLNAAGQALDVKHWCGFVTLVTE